MGYGVMSTPAVVLEDTVIHSGGVPTVEVIKTWLSQNYKKLA